MVYYLGSDFVAPVTEPFSEVVPQFYVAELDATNQAVRERLPFFCVRYLGSHNSCGCGFRRDNGGFVESNHDSEEELATQADHEALTHYLRGLPFQKRSMQIYGCWAGDEAEPHSLARTCKIGDLLSPKFGFRERELLTLIP